MPRQPAVRAANTAMRACGSLTASGRMPALDHRAVRQCRGSSNDHSMALVTTGARKTTDNVRLILRPKFPIGSAPPWLVRSRYRPAHRYDIADAAARNCGVRLHRSVMPALVAGIHVFLAGVQRERRGWPGQARP